MIKHFHTQLEQTKIILLQMAASVDKLLRDAIKSCTQIDIEKAKIIQTLDDEIDQMECKLDDDCLKMLALDQPVAADLRYIIATMRISSDIERVGDKISNIAEQTIALKDFPEITIPQQLIVLMDLTQIIFRKAIDSFRTADAGLAREVFDLNLQITEKHRKVIQIYIEIAIKQEISIEQSLHYILVIRCLDRIANLSANIAESTIFFLKGVSIKHHWPTDEEIWKSNRNQDKN